MPKKQKENTMSEPDDVETKKNAIDELKIVQDILLKQEAYSLTAFRYSFVIIVGLVVAYLSGKLTLEKNAFILLVAVSFIGFLYVQATYREAFYRGLKRSHYLQRVIGDRTIKDQTETSKNDEEYTPFYIYESFNNPNLHVTWKTFITDITNPRFYMPNLLLFTLSVIAIVYKA